MSKAKDLMGRSGAGGISPLTPANKPIVTSTDAAKPHHGPEGKADGPHSTMHAQNSGGAAAPVARRPKV